MAKASVAKAGKSASKKKSTDDIDIDIDIESISRDIESAIWIVRTAMLELRDEEQLKTGALYCAGLAAAGTLLDRANGRLTRSGPGCVGTFGDWVRWPGEPRECGTEAQEVNHG